MPRPGLNTEALLVFARAQQPVNVRMIASHFECSVKHVRERLAALLGARVLVTVPQRDELDPELRGRGRPAALYCLPDWPGLHEPASVPEHLEPPTPEDLLRVVAVSGEAGLATLCAVFEQPERVIAPLVRELLAGGRLREIEHEGLTSFALVE